MLFNPLTWEETSEGVCSNQNHSLCKAAIPEERVFHCQAPWLVLMNSCVGLRRSWEIIKEQFWVCLWACFQKEFIWGVQGNLPDYGQHQPRMWRATRVKNEGESLLAQAFPPLSDCYDVSSYVPPCFLECLLPDTRSQSKYLLSSQQQNTNSTLGNIIVSQSFPVAEVIFVQVSGKK